MIDSRMGKVSSMEMSGIVKLYGQLSHDAIQCGGVIGYDDPL